MQIKKLSIAVLFLTASGTFFYGQEVEKDSVSKEKNIEGVVIQASGNKKSETALLIDQKKAIIQKQSIGAEEISRKGISNVEQGLAKVTGISTVEGKGIFVRGLEERYNTLLVNGLGTPSNNPFQKIIALKQFPTDVVGKLNIYKTFNSNLYADFAGATFEIETLTLDKPFSKIEFGVEFNSVSTFRNFKISPSANTPGGFIGLNTKDRQLPDEVDGKRPNNFIFNQNQSLNSFKDSWNVENIKSLPNTSLGFTTSQKFKVSETGNLGFLLSLNHSSGFEIRDGAKNQFQNNGGQVVKNNEYNRKQYNYILESSALLGLGFKNRNTNLNFNAIYLQNSENLIGDFLGYSNQQVNDIRNIRINQQDISRFIDLQLSGSQKVGDRHLFKAGASYVVNNFQQPDRKFFNGQPTENPGEVKLTYGGNNLIRQYLDVNGKNYASAFAEYSVFLGEKGEKKDYPLQLSVGYNGFADIRNTSYRVIFSNLESTSNAATVMVDTPDEVFNQGIKNGTFLYKEGSTSIYRNNLYQFVNAGYLNVNFKPNDQWDILLGGRVENNINITRFKKLRDDINGPFRTIDKNEYYILPSLSIKNVLNSKSNARFSASKTITRPILIEYMPIEYINPDNETILGNPELSNSENYNLDLKYEYFPTSKEIFAVNIFGKLIDNAIERGYVASGNSNGQTITFFNANKATIYGVELEGILSLERFSETLNRWTLGANATIMHSETDRSSDQLAQEKPQNFTGELKDRQLQGAAPFTINADLKYEFKNSQNLLRTASLVYNITGSKIFTVGSAGVDHIYERPFHQLDVVYNNQFSKNWSAKFKIENILNQEYRLELGDESYVPENINNRDHTDYYRGISYSVTVGYTF